MKSLALIGLMSCVLFIGPTLLANGAGSPQGISTIPPEDETESGFKHLEDQIERYVSKNQHLPKKLSDLPVDPGYDNSLQDGWKKPFLYFPQQDGSVILSSIGGDGPDHPWSIRFSILDTTDNGDAEAETITYQYMQCIELLVQDYVAAHHRLPDKLSDLSSLDSHIYLSTVDGWGGPISYARQSDGSVLLSSRGKKGSKQVFSRQFTHRGVKDGAPTTAALGK